MQLQKSQKQINAAGLQMATISYDSTEIVKSFAVKQDLKFPVLADPDSKVIQQLGMLNTAAKEGSAKYRISLPGTVIVDQSGTVLSKLPGTVPKRHSGEQLIAAWDKVKDNATAGPFAGEAAGAGSDSKAK